MSADLPLPTHIVDALFRTGTLGQKRAEIDAVIAANATAIYDGAVSWSVFLPEEDKRMKGTAPSLTEACGFMRATLSLLLQEYNDNTEVLCAVGPS